jgi:hypothetical protein
MENDDYEGIFDDDPVVDNLIYDKVKKDLDENKKKEPGCFTVLLAISGGALLGLLFFILI